MTPRRALLLLAGATAAIAAAVAAVILLVLDRDLSPAPAVPPGPPVVASASFSPRIHLFGDVVVARVDVEADRRRVDTDSIRLRTRMRPYVPSGPVRVHRSARGTVERLQYTLRLVCLRSDCTLSSPSSPRDNPPTQRTFTVPPTIVSYHARGARQAAAVTVPWPALTVATRIASARPNDFAFTTDFAVPEPSYAVEPGLLVALLIVIGLALVLVPPAVALRGVPARLLRGPRHGALTARERAIRLLDWAAGRDVSDRRRALERVARELGSEGEPVLAERSRVVAWSRPDPDPQVAAAIGEELSRAPTTTDGNRP